MDSVVTSISGEKEWLGEDLSEEDESDLIGLLESYIKDVRTGRVRGLAIASVGANGVGGEYRNSHMMRCGASICGMAGAVHILDTLVTDAAKKHE